LELNSFKKENFPEVILIPLKMTSNSLLPSWNISVAGTNQWREKNSNVQM